MSVNENENIESEDNRFKSDSPPMFPLMEFANSIIEQTKLDFAAPYKAENLSLLVQIKQMDMAIFERLRLELNALGVPVGRFDAAIKEQEKTLKQNNPEPKVNVANILIELANDAQYFHDPDAVAYADIISNEGCRETWSVKGEGFKRWLSTLYYKKTKNAANTDSLSTAINTLAAKASIDGDERKIFIRNGIHNNKIYIDLCDNQWRVVEIDANGYRIVENAEIRFRRKKGMRPLPAPEHGGSIDELRPFLNLANDNGFILLVSWMLMAMRGHGPYPILIIIGEQGTAKSTLMSFIRQLVDPHSSPLRSLSREIRDLFIAANNSQLQAFDNLSQMSNWISDALCRLSTGGGFATRALHTDDDEMLFDAMRPIIINGIENVATRGDLVDRAIILLLEPIPEEKRKPTSQLQQEFDAALPRILGALFNMMAHGLKQLPDVHLECPPRMADFAIWATACESAAWPAGSFMQAYEANRGEANEEVITASPLAMAICAFLQWEKPQWEGTASDLLVRLSKYADDKTQGNNRLWPSTERVLGQWLRRVAAPLRKAGVDVRHARGKNNSRLIKLSRGDNGLNFSPPSPSTPQDMPTEKKLKFAKPKNAKQGEGGAQGAQ